MGTTSRVDLQPTLQTLWDLTACQNRAVPQLFPKQTPRLRCLPCTAVLVRCPGQSSMQIKEQALTVVCSDPISNTAKYQSVKPERCVFVGCTDVGVDFKVSLSATCTISQ